MANGCIHAAAAASEAAPAVQQPLQRRGMTRQLADDSGGGRAVAAAARRVSLGAGQGRLDAARHRCAGGIRGRRRAAAARRRMNMDVLRSPRAVNDSGGGELCSWPPSPLATKGHSLHAPRGRAGVVEALLAAGADPDAVSPSGKSARELATVRQQEGRGCSEPSRKRLGNLAAGDHQQEGEGDRGDRGARLQLKRSRPLALLSHLWNVERRRCAGTGRGDGRGGGDQGAHRSILRYYDPTHLK